MRDLIAFERRNQILSFVRENHRVSTRMLSKAFEVSEVTIRHDLQILQEEGWLMRIHGGAEPGPRLVQELPLSTRQTENVEAKRQIARIAQDFIESGDTILLDSSTTAFQLTPFLANYRNLTVVTNNINVGQVLGQADGVEVIIVGGSIRSETWSIVGPLAEDFIAKLRVDKAFFGAAGVSIKRGLTDADIHEVQIKRTMAASAEQIYVLVDSTKFGKESFSTTITLEQIHTIISDNILQEFASSLKHLGVRVIMAND